MDGRWDKNDTKDSANAADLVSQGKCRFYEQAEPHIVALRNLLSVRKRLKRQDHGLRMQIRNGLIAKYFPEMDKFWRKSLEENMAIVRWYLDPRKIAATDFELLVQHVTTRSRGGGQLRRLQSIYDAAKDSVGLALDEAAIFEANMLVESYHHTKEQIDQTMQQIVQACENLAQHKLLMTIPGFGPYISAMVIAAIGKAKLLVIAWTMLKNNEAFDADRLAA